MDRPLHAHRPAVLRHRRARHCGRVPLTAAARFVSRFPHPAIWTEHPRVVRRSRMATNARDSSCDTNPTRRRASRSGAAAMCAGFTDATRPSRSTSGNSGGRRGAYGARSCTPPAPQETVISGEARSATVNRKVRMTCADAHLPTSARHGVLARHARGRGFESLTAHRFCFRREFSARSAALRPSRGASRGSRRELPSSRFSGLQSGP